MNGSREVRGIPVVFGVDEIQAMRRSNDGAFSLAGFKKVCKRKIGSTLMLHLFGISVETTEGRGDEKKGPKLDCVTLRDFNPNYGHDFFITVTFSTDRDVWRYKWRYQFVKKGSLSGTLYLWKKYHVQKRQK